MSSNPATLLKAMSPPHPSLLIISAASQLPLRERTWGSGSWLAPEERESLDWLTLARTLGWGVRLVQASQDELRSAMNVDYRCLILSAGPDGLTTEDAALIASKLTDHPMTFVAQSSKPGSPLEKLQGVSGKLNPIEGKELRWDGPGPKTAWHCRNSLKATALRPAPGTRTLATLNGTPLIAAKPLGKSLIVTLGFHPSEARDQDGCVTALLKHLLIFESPEPVAWFDWDNTMVLRMDDPGGAQNVYSRSWSYPKLTEADWAQVGDDLARRDACLSTGYISGWVDDGNSRRGDLQVNGHAVPRKAGTIHPSPEVCYHDKAGHRPGTIFDYQAEYRGLRRLQESGLVTIELHGFTHIHPDIDAWLRADDRFESEDWYRELGKSAQPFLAKLTLSDHPITRGLITIEDYFGSRPTTLICPGEQFTDETLSTALDAGLRLIGSYYLAIRHDDRFCWNQHVCAPYLNELDGKWFTSGLPVIGYFHDRELSLEGVDWMTRWLDAWQNAGARRFVDYRHLASALGKTLSLRETRGELQLTVHEEASLQSPVPLDIRFTTSLEPPPASVTVVTRESSFSAPVESVDPHQARLLLRI